MNESESTETIACPYCGDDDGRFWASENGFTAEKCVRCGLVYVNPRPVRRLVDTAVETGIHIEVDHGRDAIARRVPRKTRFYRSVFGKLLADVWSRTEPITWLDVGAGYGEVIQAIQELSPDGSRIEGIEPMKPKAKAAKELGLPVANCDLSGVQGEYDFVSIINVFSHIPDFRAFMQDVLRVTAPGGEILIETGNAGDLPSSRYVPTELDLPDHLVFAGERHVKGYLNEFGYEVVAVHRRRRDGIIETAKNIVKKLLGRRVFVRIPYTSPHRSIIVRARLPD